MYLNLIRLLRTRTVHTIFTIINTVMKKIIVKKLRPNCGNSVNRHLRKNIKDYEEPKKIKK